MVEERHKKRKEFWFNLFTKSRKTIFGIFDFIENYSKIFFLALGLYQARLLRTQITTLGNNVTMSIEKIDKKYDELENKLKESIKPPTFFEQYIKPFVVQLGIETAKQGSVFLFDQVLVNAPGKIFNGFNGKGKKLEETEAALTQTQTELKTTKQELETTQAKLAEANTKLQGQNIELKEYHHANAALATSLQLAQNRSNDVRDDRDRDREYIDQLERTQSDLHRGRQEDLYRSQGFLRRLKRDNAEDARQREAIAKQLREKDEQILEIQEEIKERDAAIKILKNPPKKSWWSRLSPSRVSKIRYKCVK